MNDLSNLTQSFVTNKAGLAAGTTTTYSTTAAPLQYCIKGKAYTKTAVTNGATPTTDVVDGLAFTPQAIGQASVYVFCFNAAGTIGVAQGGIETQDVTGNLVRPPQFPIIPDGYVPFGYMLVRLAPSTAVTPAVAAWQFGVNNNSGVTGVTYAFDDVMMLPDRPQST